MQIAIGRDQEKKKKKTCLARGEELLVAFLVVLGSLAYGWGTMVARAWRRKWKKKVGGWKIKILGK